MSKTSAKPTALYYQVIDYILAYYKNKNRDQPHKSFKMSGLSVFISGFGLSEEVMSRKCGRFWQYF